MPSILHSFANYFPLDLSWGQTVGNMIENEQTGNSKGLVFLSNLEHVSFWTKPRGDDMNWIERVP